MILLSCSYIPIDYINSYIGLILNKKNDFQVFKEICSDLLELSELLNICRI